MRRFIVFLGIVLVLGGLRLFDNGLLNLGERGTFTVYSGGAESVYSEDDLPLLYRHDGYSRLDTVGSLESVYAALERISAVIVRTERAGDIVLVYAYSPYINTSVTLSGDVINVMVAVNGERVAYGSPILKGSY